MAAGDNEKKFIDFVEAKFGVGTLKGKCSYWKVFDGYPEKVSISVDQSIVLSNGIKVLFEVDSGNYAKLLAGQYALLNGMYSDVHADTLFCVVHFYKEGSNGREYSARRTMKNLNAIHKLNPDAFWMPRTALSFSDFSVLVSMSNSVEELVASLWAESNESRIPKLP